VKRALVLLLLPPFTALAQQPDPVQRAVIERDRQSAEFARPELRDLHLRRDLQHLPPRPDEQAVEARERDAQPKTTEKQSPTPEYAPLPLPGGPTHLVNPIPVQGRGS
jgi:hypothetical protein